MGICNRVGLSRSQAHPLIAHQFGAGIGILIMRLEADILLSVPLAFKLLHDLGAQSCIRHEGREGDFRRGRSRYLRKPEERSFDFEDYWQSSTNFTARHPTFPCLLARRSATHVLEGRSSDEKSRAISGGTNTSSVAHRRNAKDLPS